MPSPSQPAHLSNHQRTTPRQNLQHPAGHNIERRTALPLLRAIGSAEERYHGKVAVTIGSQTEYFDPPRHKDIAPRQLSTCAGCWPRPATEPALRIPEPAAGRS